MKNEAVECPRLVAFSGPGAGEVFHLDGDVTIGRDAGNAVPLADPSLSRRHCAILRQGDGWRLQDLASCNGTFVNGVRVVDHALADSDWITAGDSQLLFRCGADRRAEDVEPGADAFSSTRTLRIEDAAYLRGGPPGDCAPSIESSRLARDLQALVRLSTSVQRIRHREALYAELLDAAFGIVPAAQAALLWIEPGASDPQLFGLRGNEKDAPVAVSQTVLRQTIASREAILSNNVSSDAAWRRAASLVDARVTSVLSVPLVLEGGRVAAVIYLSSGDGGPPFDGRHLEAVAALAGIGGLALQNLERLEWLEAEKTRLQAECGIAHEMIGDSQPMHEVYTFIRKVAPTDATVLIAGETGTGKELAARALHANSRRCERPFVAINCAALTEPLLESELFGHERGAFTGAIATKKGKLETADGGTVFLDEVGELSPALQAKLLRVLQTREFERVGGTRTIKVDVRVISATNRDLQQAVETRAFRHDLLFRLNVVTLDMPPLRRRREDIPLLAAHFARAAAAASGRGVAGLSDAAVRCLRDYDWPGNVRELENAIERAVVLGSTPDIVPEDLPEPVVDARRASGDVSRFHEAVTDAKKRVILDAVARCDGRLTDAARLLGLHPNYLHRLLSNLDLRPSLPPKLQPAGRDR